MEQTMTTIQTEIEEHLAQAAPAVEVLLVEPVGRDTLRIFIDHPDGVTLELCEQVTHALSDYRERYVLEVSSPGSDRPLTKPDHYSRFIGQRARLRLSADVKPAAADSKLKHPVNLTGEIVGASEEEVTIAADSGVVALPYSQIVRSNLVPGE
jgi:ribosome maturation factor RimP